MNRDVILLPITGGIVFNALTRWRVEKSTQFSSFGELIVGWG